MDWSDVLDECGVKDVEFVGSTNHENILSAPTPSISVRITIDNTISCLAAAGTSHFLSALRRIVSSNMRMRD
jgi:hypothetical protein